MSRKEEHNKSWGNFTPRTYGDAQCGNNLAFKSANMLSNMPEGCIVSLRNGSDTVRGDFGGIRIFDGGEKKIFKFRIFRADGIQVIPDEYWSWFSLQFYDDDSGVEYGSIAMEYSGGVHTYYKDWEEVDEKDIYLPSTKQWFYDTKKEGKFFTRYYAVSYSDAWRGIYTYYPDKYKTADRYLPENKIAAGAYNVFFHCYTITHGATASPEYTLLPDAVFDDIGSPLRYDDPSFNSAAEAAWGQIVSAGDCKRSSGIWITTKLQYTSVMTVQTSVAMTLVERVYNKDSGTGKYISGISFNEELGRSTPDGAYLSGSISNLANLSYSGSIVGSGTMITGIDREVSGSAVVTAPILAIKKNDDGEYEVDGSLSSHTLSVTIQPSFPPTEFNHGYYDKFGVYHPYITINTNDRIYLDSNRWLTENISFGYGY